MTPSIKSIPIKASVPIVWETLTNPALMKQWMAEPEMNLEISTNWKAGSPIIIKGFHHVKFENRGTVLQFEPEKVLRYNHLSSLSRLPDKPESYSVIEFRLEPQEDQTLLTVSLSNFPTETIFKHLDFYWNGTLDEIRKLAELLIRNS